MSPEARIRHALTRDALCSRAQVRRIKTPTVMLPSLPAIAFAARPSGHGGTGAPVGR